MFRRFLSGVCRHGRQAFDGIVKSQRPLTSAPVSKHAQQFVCQAGRNSVGSLTAFSKYFGKYAAQNLAADLRRQAALRFQGGSFSIIGAGKVGQKLPLFAFLGVSLAAGYQKKSYTSDDVCDHIKELFKPTAEYNDAYVEHALGKSVADYNFGGLIAKGCNAAVYSAVLKQTSDDEDGSTTEDSATDSECDSFEVITEVDEAVEGFVDEPDYYNIYEDPDNFSEVDSEEDSFEIITANISDSFNNEMVKYSDDSSTLSPVTDNSYAVKMMFLYNPESTLYQIQHVMETELLPAKLASNSELMNIWENGNHVRKKQLPPHPNIVEMMGCFVDDMPCFPDALAEYPVALPERINPDGLGCNKTLFLVMKRYPCTLRQYLANEVPTLRQSTILFAQLMEAVVHLGHNDIAHRDLKSDNILLDDDSGGYRKLVITDFGSSLLGLRQWYPCAAVSRGGNAVLMAPEIASASPGFLHYLDYEKADLWAAGAIAYEIFGGCNPFYMKGGNLDSRSYLNSNLPHLPEHVPTCIETIITLALRKNPSQRPSADMLADMLHIVLWGPEHWLYDLTFGRAPPTILDLKRWLLTLSAEVMCRRCWQSLGGSTSVDQQLKQQFLARLNIGRLSKSVDALWGI